MDGDGDIDCKDELIFICVVGKIIYFAPADFNCDGCVALFDGIQMAKALKASSCAESITLSLCGSGLQGTPNPIYVAAGKGIRCDFSQDCRDYCGTNMRAVIDIPGITSGPTILESGHYCQLIVPKTTAPGAYKYTVSVYDGNTLCSGPLDPYIVVEAPTLGKLHPPLHGGHLTPHGITSNENMNTDLAHSQGTNPFSSQTRLQFSISHDQDVKIEVFNISGKRVRNLFGGWLSSGEHSLSWDGRDDSRAPLPSGIYFYRLERQNASPVTKKVVLIR